MDNFEAAYKQLNGEQRQAVDTIDGPVLVMAGPGTGKTQLLSLRVANILQKTDTDPANILCLTFTENGATNMRERLSRFIGQAAYNVGISTYHAFGGDLIRRFPEYFAETRLENPVDELGKHQIMAELVESLSYRNPLKQTSHHLGDLISTISEIKRALLDADSLRALATENATFITAANAVVREVFDDFTKMPSDSAKALTYFERTFAGLQKLVPAQPTNARFGSLAFVAVMELQSAVETAQKSGKTNALTAWKNNWLAKDADNHFVFDGVLENKRIEALADVLEKYQEALSKRGLYDFDDMIIRSITALEKNKDLRYTLHEQYLYLLLDEFQDTNAAQLKLIELLTDNPVNEGRPNVLAVGDDDQAIYAFQGAQYSNMLDFYNLYRDVMLINLTKNYRSHADILLSAKNVAEQIEARLHHHFGGITKNLTAANPNLPKKPVIVREEYLSAIAQYDAMAAQIERLIKSGTDPREIAVLAPKHSQLVPLVAYLNSRGVPVRYEKRENILDAPVVTQLVAMSRLLLALKSGNESLANSLWPQVLSFEFWQIPTSTIWELSWQVNESEKNISWSQALLSNSVCRNIALLFLALAPRVDIETCEAMLDFLIGSDDVSTKERDMPTVRSPLRAFYTSRHVQTGQPEIFYETLSHLTVLRARLRDHQITGSMSLKLSDLIDLVELYEQAGQAMINTSPYNQRANAVQLMTVFKAKGLEFEHIFLPCCQDDVWGSASRGNNNKLSLPANLRPIRHAGATDDERLRILFVALTRAKFGLHLSSFTENYNGKTTKRLKYFNEQEQPDGSFKTMILPDAMQTVAANDHAAPELKVLELDWHERHFGGFAETKLRDLLTERLKNYQLSASDLNTFVDVVFSGPEEVFFKSILRFPQAPTPASQFGNALHETMEWLQHQVDEHDSLPPLDKTIEYFTVRMQKKRLTRERTELEIERGTHALTAWLKQRGHILKAGNRAEYNFRGEGVFVGKAHLSGKVDSMEIDKKNKQITIVDYKTGKSFEKWKSDTKLHKYRQQLYFYKLLIENSHTFKDYTVEKGRLEFIEPDREGRVNTLEVIFDSKELDHTVRLIEAVWQHIMDLNFPDISMYSENVSDIRRFEIDLLNRTI